MPLVFRRAGIQFARGEAPCESDLGIRWASGLPPGRDTIRAGRSPVNQILEFGGPLVFRHAASISKVVGVQSKGHGGQARHSGGGEASKEV